MKQPQLKNRGIESEQDPAIAPEKTTLDPGTQSGDSTATTDDTTDADLEPDDHPEPQSPKSNMRRVILIVAGVSALIGGGVWCWHWLQFQHTHPSTDNAQITGHASPLSPKISATVKQVLVKEGDYVKAGQTLVVLEDQDLHLKVLQAEASLASAQAQLQSAIHTLPLTSQTNSAQVEQSQANLSASDAAVSTAQANIVQARATVKTNQAKVAQAQADLVKTQKDLQRYGALYEAGAIAAQQLDTARAAADDAQATLAAAQQTVAQSEAQVNSTQAEFRQAQAQAAAAHGKVTETQAAGQQLVVQQDTVVQDQAQVKQNQANLALARQQLQYTVIKAPINGYIGNLTAQVGQRVQSEQQMMSLVPLQTDQIYVEANFKETAIKELHIGQPADIEVDAYPGQVFHAAIAGISPATGANFALLPPDNATGNFNKVVQWVPIRLEFRPDADPQHKLRAGLNVKVTVDTTANASTQAALKP